MLVVTRLRAEAKVVFYLDQSFQPKPVLVDLVEGPNITLFQPFLVETLSCLYARKKDGCHCPKEQRKKQPIQNEGFLGRVST